MHYTINTLGMWTPQSIDEVFVRSHPFKSNSFLDTLYVWLLIGGDSIINNVKTPLDRHHISRRILILIRKIKFEKERERN